MTPTTETVPRRQQGTATRHDTGTQTGPPTLPNGSQRRMTKNTRAHRKADAMIAELDQVVAYLCGPKATTLPTYVAHRRRFHDIVSRDDQPSTLDGYTSRHGDTSGTRGGPVSVPTGDPNEPGYVTLDGPLAMVLRRPDADVVHRAHLILADRVRTLLRSVNDIDNAQRTVPASPGQPAPKAALCSHCRLEPGDRETDVDGMLPGARFLCVTCITFVERQAGSPPHLKPRLPNPAELDARRTGKKPRVRENPTAPFSFRNLDGSRSTTGLTPPPPTAA